MISLERGMWGLRLVTLRPSYPRDWVDLVLLSAGQVARVELGFRLSIRQERA